jgi:UDP-hydrolysing UDP-N-acetyl-D-glucosamine 2-epimerase
MTRTIALLTTGRQDWGILRSVAAGIREEPSLRLALVAGGMALSTRHGHPVDAMHADGYAPDAELAWIPDEADPPADAQAAGALAAVGGWLRGARPDALVLVGDRLETAAAALAATLAAVPIVHLHGGEQTLGAFDDALRHAITKLAHLHLVSHEEHARRVVALGEDPAAVHVVGAPGLDNLWRDDLPGRAELESLAGIPLEPPLVLVTVHPATLEADPAAAARAVAAAMDAVPATYLVTLPNADPGGDEARRLLEAAVAADPARRAAVASLGERAWWGALRLADAMLGNSSSALIEGPAVRLPAVDVGDRQAGRRRSASVLATPADPGAVTAALRRALDPATRAAIPPLDPGLADGRAGERAARIIAAWQPPVPPRKPPVRIAP